MLRITGGRVYDPANEVDGEVRLICLKLKLNWLRVGPLNIVVLGTCYFWLQNILEDLQGRQLLQFYFWVVGQAHGQSLLRFGF